MLQQGFLMMLFYIWGLSAVFLPATGCFSAYILAIDTLASSHQPVTVL